MITINKVNKYFNKNKRNEIHVIKNTSLEFPSNGLVALLGPSGSGKTTLLNTIGGLDKVNSGTIFVNNKKITKISTSKIDEIRNIDIGYIFQDYNLIDDISVFDNVSLVLKMIGIKDKNIIKTRVNYVLEKLGIYKYRNRPAGMLSGGERQRVSIARAIVKNPSIIIADEPTGNLDSKNTIEIMNIIKSISKDKLVILVTHEKDIAYFYATRVIELCDGKIISDKENDSNELDYRIENKIYLKDIKNHFVVEGDNIDVDYYSENNNKLKVTIVSKNGNIYIKTSSNDKLEIIDSNSSMELVDDNYKKLTKETYEKYNFDYKEILHNDNLKYSSIYNIVTLISSGFKKIKSYPILKKILLLGFFFSAMSLLYSISNIAGIITIKDEKFTTHNKSYLLLSTNKIEKDKYLEYEKLDNINYIMPGNSSVEFSIKYNFYYQTNYATDILKGSLSSINMLKEDDLIFGRMPNNEYEIVVDKLSIENMFNGYTAKQVGLIRIEDVIGLEANINDMNTFTIVGVTNKKSPSIYTYESMFINIIANSSFNGDMNIWGYQTISEVDKEYLDYKLTDKYLLKAGKLPKNDYEVMVNYNDRYTYSLNKEIKKTINDKKLKVVGYYESNIYNLMFTNENTIKYKLLDDKSSIIVYPKDKDKTIEYFEGRGLNIKDIYEQDKEEYILQHKDSIISSIIVAAIILVISLVEIYLMIRSSFLSRIKEVGTLRAIGVKKKDIYNMFAGEILAITLSASLAGIILMIYIINGLIELPIMKDKYMLNPIILFISCGLILVFNLLVGLLPVRNTIRKTPAQILSRTDID